MPIYSEVLPPPTVVRKNSFQMLVKDMYIVQSPYVIEECLRFILLTICTNNICFELSILLVDR